MKAKSVATFERLEEFYSQALLVTLQCRTFFQNCRYPKALPLTQQADFPKCFKRRMKTQRWVRPSRFSLNSCRFSDSFSYRRKRMNLSLSQAAKIGGASHGHLLPGLPPVLVALYASLASCAFRIMLSCYRICCKLIFK